MKVVDVWTVGLVQTEEGILRRSCAAESAFKQKQYISAESQELCVEVWKTSNFATFVGADPAIWIVRVWVRYL